MLSRGVMGLRWGFWMKRGLSFGEVEIGFLLGFLGESVGLKGRTKGILGVGFRWLSGGGF